ncbi:hypothetical protein EV368DRAFT_64209 [Lentinula lateritia]|uniref:Uncharacterized protein n=1 Tax=Lentinula aff. lateritia TaxID=2804960 RepID=A0ACC1U9J7_9AGAR|nr:hypothetical protein F5876DRAFT_63190 [Lentinula aff. lateritia]KAJ3853268.1 hypothetical protein EV368DRAFT_64209 [Lentinula lateritia]
MAATSAVAILLSVASLAIQVYAAVIPSASSPPSGKFSDDLDVPSASATSHIQGLPSVSMRNTPPAAVSLTLDSTIPKHVNSIMETRTREQNYLTPRRLDGQKKSSSKNIPLDPSETEKKEEQGKGKGDMKGAPPPKKQSKQQSVEMEIFASEQLAERKRIKAAIPKLATKKTTKTTLTTSKATKVPEKTLNNPLVNPIIKNIVFGNGQNGPSFSKPKNSDDSCGFSLFRLRTITTTLIPKR